MNDPGREVFAVPIPVPDPFAVVEADADVEVEGGPGTVFRPMEMVLEEWIGGGGRNDDPDPEAPFWAGS